MVTMIYVIAVNVAVAVLIHQRRRNPRVVIAVVNAFSYLL